MSVITDIEYEIAGLIKLQEKRANDFERQIRQFPTKNEDTHKLEAFRERALESIPHLEKLLHELKEMQHFSPKLLPHNVYAFFEEKLKGARLSLKQCKSDMSHLAKAYELIAEVRNALPGAERAAHAQMEAQRHQVHF
jgi:hypothetical protein